MAKRRILAPRRDKTTQPANTTVPVAIRAPADGLEIDPFLAAMPEDAAVVVVTQHLYLTSRDVQAVREGAADFLHKQVRAEALRTSVDRVVASSQLRERADTRQNAVATRLATLTERERQVLECVVAGQATKNIAADLRISERTVEHHRHVVRQKIGATSLAMLVRLVAPLLPEQ